jgi:hypothetical protein
MSRSLRLQYVRGSNRMMPKFIGRLTRYSVQYLCNFLSKFDTLNTCSNMQVVIRANILAINLSQNKVGFENTESVKH